MFLAVALVAVNVFFWLGASAFGLSTSVIGDLFGSRMIRAEVIVQAPDGSTQDWLIDRGLITAVAGNTVTIRERDGRVVTLQVDPAARVAPPRFTVSQLRRRLRVVLFHQANAPAEIVQIEGIGP
jgi:hypothetical protein